MRNQSLRRLVLAVFTALVLAAPGSSAFFSTTPIGGASTQVLCEDTVCH